MKTAFLSAVLLLLFFPMSLNAQELPDYLTPDQQVTFGNRLYSSQDGISLSATDSKGNLILAGYTHRDFSFRDVQLTSLDSDLKPLWNDRLSWDGLSYDLPVALLVDKQDHIWLVAKNFEKEDKLYFVIVRYSPQGEKLWEYRSPEPVNERSLIPEQEHYFLDAEGYLNFNYSGRSPRGYSPSFFRISPEGVVRDEYQVEDGSYIWLAHTDSYYHALDYRNGDPDKVFYVKIDKNGQEEQVLPLTQTQVERLTNNIIRAPLTDRNDNLVLVTWNNFYSPSKQRQGGTLILSVKPSGEVHYFRDVDWTTETQLLGSMILDSNELLVLTNSRPAGDATASYGLSLELFSEAGELLYTKRDAAVEAGMVTLLQDQILVHATSGSIYTYDLKLNLLSETRVPEPEVSYLPQGLQQLDGAPVLVGKNTYSTGTEQNQYVRKFRNNALVAEYEFSGEGVSSVNPVAMRLEPSGDILAVVKEFVGFHKRSSGEWEPEQWKLLRYNSDLELQEEVLQPEEYDLRPEPLYSFKAENGDQYRYEIKPDRKTVEFYLNSSLKWTRVLELGGKAGMEIGHVNQLDREGNLILSSSLRNSDGKIHKLSPENEYTVAHTGSRINRILILSNNWIFTYFNDYSIRIFSPELEVIRSTEYSENYFREHSMPNLLEINNQVLLNLRQDDLVLVFDQYGRNTGRFRLEGHIDTFNAFVDSNKALNVFHRLGGSMSIESWSRAAISRYDLVGKQVAKMPEGDSDGDGVADLQDWCPDTASGVPVDKNGCALPFFQLSIRSETCIGKSNGILKVVAPEAGAYSLELAGEVTNFGKELQLENLAPGTHEVCIQAVGDANSRQCFSFVIEAGQDFKAESFVNGNTLSVKVRQGSAPYKASINGKPAGTFHSSDFELAVKHGDLLEISSALVCEGKLELAVSLENIPQLRRNPVEVTAEVLLPYEFSGPVAVKIYNASGQLLETQLLRPENALNLNINTLSLPPGIYYLQLQLEKVYGLKMIKR